MERTLYRPREVIQFCQEAIEAARTARIALPLPVIRSAETRYSDERTKDIAAEYRFQYPGLLLIFEVFRGGGYEIERDDLEYRCLQMIVGETVRHPVALDWLKHLDPSGLAELLWQVGFLTAQVTTQGARTQDDLAFVGPHHVRRVNLANAHRFQIHRMFRAYLGLNP